jgi:serine/threonine-protein kinase
MRSIIKWMAVVVTVAVGLTACTKKQTPTLVGLDLNTATAKIQEAGLTVGRVDKEFGGTQSLGIVLRQDPAAATAVGKGTTVNLVVEDHVVVPNLVGRDHTAARDLLMESELKAGEISETSEADSDAVGTILSQRPEMGTKVARGTEVALKIARSAPQTAQATPTKDGTDDQVKQIVGGLLDIGRKELERKLEDR